MQRNISELSYVEEMTANKGSCSNKEIKFQHIPGWIEVNVQDISETVYHTSVAINMLSKIYFAIFRDAFSSSFLSN